MSNNNIDDVYHLLTQINEGYTAPLNARYNDLIVEGNLTVNGETTVLNTTTVELEDPIIMINKTGTGSSLEKSGLEVKRGVLTNQRLIFDESDDKWKAGLSGSEQNITLSSTPLTQGSIPYADASGNLTQNNSGLFYSGTNLGLGTTSPISLLHVSNIGAGSLTPATNVITATNTPQLSLVMGDTRNYDSNGNGYEWDRGCHWIFNADGQNKYTSSGSVLNNLAGISMAYHNVGSYTDATQGATNIKFYTTGPNSGNTAKEFTEKMRIQYNGNVGIATTNPSSKLHIATTIGSSDLIKCTSTYPSGGGSEDVSFNVKTDGTGNSILTMGDAFHNGTDANIKVQLHSAGNSFLSGGNLGLGTSNPSQRLDVAGNIAMTGGYRNLSLSGGNSTGYLFGAYNGLGNYDGIHLGYNYFNNNTSDSIPNAGGKTSRLTVGYGEISLWTGSNNIVPTIKMIVNDIGNVGIGTASPNASAILDLTATTKGFLPPRTTSASITTPVAGLTIYDTGLNNITLYNGTSWVPIPKPNFFNVYYSNVSAENSTTTTITAGTSYFRLGLGSTLFKGESNLFNINGNFMSCKYVGATTSKNSQHKITISYLADTSCITTWIVYKNATFTGEKITGGTIMYDSRARQSITNSEQNNISLSFMDAPTLNDTYHVGIFHSHGNNVVITPSTFNWMVHSY